MHPFMIIRDDSHQCRGFVLFSSLCVLERLRENKSAKYHLQLLKSERTDKTALLASPFARRYITVYKYGTVCHLHDAC